MTNEEHTTHVETLLRKAGDRLSESPGSNPSRRVLQSALQSARTAPADPADVTNPAAERYSIRRIVTEHMRVFVSATVTVAVLLVIGSGLYLTSGRTDSSSSATQSQAIRHSPPRPTQDATGAPGQSLPASQSGGPSAQSDQSIDQSISQIDSQMAGLADDNKNVDQSTAQAAQ